MIDILAIGAHPDDVELCAGGTLLVHKELGYKTGILDLTWGEMGTRGTVAQRQKEAQNASSILKLDFRDNLNLEDALFTNTFENQKLLIQKIRGLQPTIILANAEYDRHPDHGRAANLVEEACFLSGLKKIETLDNEGQRQTAHRPKKIFHYIQSISINPDFYVDISKCYAAKVQAYKAYKSQLYDPKNTAPNTYISSPEFLDLLEARAIEFGNRIGVHYAEGFTLRTFLGTQNLFQIL